MSWESNPGHKLSGPAAKHCTIQVKVSEKIKISHLNVNEEDRILLHCWQEEIGISLVRIYVNLAVGRLSKLIFRVKSLLRTYSAMKSLIIVNMT